MLPVEVVRFILLPPLRIGDGGTNSNDKKAAVRRQGTECGLRLCPAPIALLFGVVPRRLGREREGHEP